MVDARYYCGNPNYQLGVAYSADFGWDKNDLTWSIHRYIPPNQRASWIPQAEQKRAIREAFGAWAAEADLHFTEMQDGQPADILLSFLPKDHVTLTGYADSPFADNHLAHAFLPNPLDGTHPLEGDVHFYQIHNWGIDATRGFVDTKTVAIHEIGHGLGLGHSDNQDAVMYYIMLGPKSLHADDIAGIQHIYGERQVGNETMNVTRTVLAHPANYYIPAQMTRTGYNKIFIHSTRSGVAGRTDLEVELGSTINWFLNQNAQASTHLIASPNALVRVVYDINIAKHVGEDNQDSLGIELTQPGVYTPYPDSLLRQAARAVSAWCDLYGIPKVRLASYVPGQKGIIGHEDGRHGVRVGKSDPGPAFPWDRFMEMVRGEEGDADVAQFSDEMAQLIATHFDSLLKYSKTDDVNKYGMPNAYSVWNSAENGKAAYSEVLHLKNEVAAVGISAETALVKAQEALELVESIPNIEGLDEILETMNALRDTLIVFNGRLRTAGLALQGQ